MRPRSSLLFLLGLLLVILGLGGTLGRILAGSPFGDYGLLLLLAVVGVVVIVLGARSVD